MAVVKDPVRPADRDEVYRRDNGCIAPQIDPSTGPCRDIFGKVVTLDQQRELIRRQDYASRSRRGKVLTIDHVPRKPGSTRISKPRWMVTACWGHGVHNGPGGTVWVTAHRADERRWLEDRYGPDMGD